MSYTYDQVKAASLEYFKGDELAADVFAGKYALQNERGELLELTPADAHRRMAREFARIEAKYPNPMSEEEIFELLADFTVVPQGSPMSGIGNPHQVQSLSNCFVIESPYDSYGGIMRTDEEEAQIMKRRGGVGYDLSTLRPRNQLVTNAARTATGIGIFMERGSNTCREVGQEGRRGALMLTISVHHPDVLEFANLKRDRTKVTGANVSIRITDEFMRAVAQDLEYEQRFPVDRAAKRQVSRMVKARDVWNNVTAAMRDCSEPGFLFWDTIERMSPADIYAAQGYKTLSTNPCLTGDTRVMVADGRGYVTLKELADAGDDVPVYSVNPKTGRREIQTMRKPRLTGEREPVFKVTFEGGFSFKANANHQMLLADGTECRVDGLNDKLLWAFSEVDQSPAHVLSVEPCGIEAVYNGTVDETHTFCILPEGPSDDLVICSANCGEIPLSVGDSCRLLLVNISKFVKTPFKPTARFDFDRFSSVVQKAQRLMDDLVDLELEAIDRIIAKIEADPEPEDIKQVELNLWQRLRQTGANGRRTGLGITALGDTFAYLGIRYGAPESLTVTESIYRSLCLASYRSSVVMAKERGPFPVFNHEQEKGHPFLERVMGEDPELAQLYAQYGRRNIANLTTAPAGSMSILTQTTSGCEPVLFVSARRKRKINPSDKQSRVDEVDKLGDKWQYYDIFHEGVKKWMEVTGEIDVSKSPYFGSTVEEISPPQKVQIQATAQKYIDHSISVTNNLPKDVTEDATRDIVWRAWETGCKGVTIYRIGSRDAVIVKETDSQGQPLEIVEHHAPKRPKALTCHLHRTTVQGQKYLVLVGLVNDKPYEIFAGLEENVESPKKATTGTLVKNGKKDGIATYNLHIPIAGDDEIVLKDVVNLFNNPIHGAFTRTISLALRHGVPVRFLVEQLQKDKTSDITSFQKCVARVLSKHYIPDGTKVVKNEGWPHFDIRVKEADVSCSTPQIVYLGGCPTCMTCGWSKC